MSLYTLNECLPDHYPTKSEETQRSGQSYTYFFCIHSCFGGWRSIFILLWKWFISGSPLFPTMMHTTSLFDELNDIRLVVFNTRSTFVICINTYIYRCMYMCLFCTLKLMLILTHQASKLENIHSEVETQSTKSEI